MRVTIVRSEAVATAASSVLTAVRRAQLGSLLRRCGAQLGVHARAGLTLRLAADAELAELNRGFLGVDEPTDVLAFPAGEPGYVGDVVISVERAIRQAPGGDAAAELRLLAVHGLLHCLGHDHAEPADAVRMTEATRTLLPDQRIPDLVAAGQDR
jgi:probable rRNA maturation factor